MPNSIVRTAYERAKYECGADCKGAQAGEAILQLALTSLQFLLKKCQPIELISRVPGKRYFSFKKGRVVARPANEGLFVMDSDVVKHFWESWLVETISPQDFARLTYTIALAPCLAMELFDRQNKKGPATFFECYIGHMFARAVEINPTKKARLPVHDRPLKTRSLVGSPSGDLRFLVSIVLLMTMDFLFDMGNRHRKVHLLARRQAI